MRVQELEELLARLPADMLVHVSGGGIGAHHITLADKQPRKRAEKVTFKSTDDVWPALRGQRTVLIPGDGSYVLPPSLILRGGAAWFTDEPEWTLRGNWPRAKAVPDA